MYRHEPSFKSEPPEPDKFTIIMSLIGLAVAIVVTAVIAISIG